MRQRRVLLSIFAILLALLLTFTKMEPAFSGFSSVDSYCSRNPETARQCASAFGVSASTIADAPVVGSTTLQIATTLQGGVHGPTAISAAPGAIGGTVAWVNRAVGAFLAAIGIGFVSGAGISKLQAYVFEEYCKAGIVTGSPAKDTGASWIVDPDRPPFEKTRPYLSKELDPETYIQYDHRGGSSYYFRYGWFSKYYFNPSVEVVRCSQVGYTWADWGYEDRRAAAETFMRTPEFSKRLPSAISKVFVELPPKTIGATVPGSHQLSGSSSATTTLSIPPAVFTAEDPPLDDPEPSPSPSPDPPPSPSPSPDPPPSPSPSPSPDPSPGQSPGSGGNPGDGGDGGSNPGGSGTPPSPTPSPSVVVSPVIVESPGGNNGGGGGGGGGGDPSPSPSPSVEPPPVPPPVVPIEPQEFSGENWLEHGVNVFKTKFPFDLFGTVTAPSDASECPNFEFFNQKVELCIIKDFLSILKWPIIIGFTIRIYHSL